MAIFLLSGMRNPHTAYTATIRIATSVITLIAEAVIIRTYNNKPMLGRCFEKLYPVVTYVLVEATAIRWWILAADALKLDEKDEHDAVDDVENNHEPDPEPHFPRAGRARHKDA
jgi:hypothetical protein